VFGHTHRALVQTVGATLVVNPGAAGPRRFRLPPSIALLTLERGRAHAEVVALAP
jgi:predicted phosphodiesterase